MSGQVKPVSRHHENKKLYAKPLPIILDPTSGSQLWCAGVFDKLTKSVWVTNHEQAMVLWHHGFFGKGDLSRSEPTWSARQENARDSNGKRTSHLICSLLHR